MTREEQVRAALKEIAPSESDLAACIAAIEEKVDAVARLRKTDKKVAALHSDAATKAWAAYHKALIHLRETYKTVLKSGGEHPLRRSPDGSWREVLTLDDINALIKVSEPTPKQRVVASPALSKDRPVPDILPLPEGAVLRAGAAKSMTTAFSRELLERYCPDQHFPTTRGGRWHKLSAILYGDEEADLYQYLSAFRYFRDQK